MLDDVERRTFPVNPAREYPVPVLVRALDVDLDEGAGQFFALPRRRRLAGAQADDDVLDPDRLAGLQRQVANDAVALVEQAQHGDPLGHRRDPRLIGGGARHGDRDGIAFARLLEAAVAAGQRREQGQCNRAPGHVWSGVQAL